MFKPPKDGQVTQCSSRNISSAYSAVIITVIGIGNDLSNAGLSLYRLAPNTFNWIDFQTF